MDEKKRKVKLVEWSFEGQRNERRRNIVIVNHGKTGDKLKVTRT
jgi:hypothetical protein